MKRQILVLLTLAILSAFVSVLILPKQFYKLSVDRRFGKTIHQTQSAYSHIRVRERGSIRSMMFVDEHGTEQRQSAIDLEAPHEMQLGYTRSLFASLLFRHPQEHVLIVGLGGGGMVRFLNHHFPESHVDAVEIDPEVVRIAEDYFGTRERTLTSIHTEDAFVYLQEPHGPYDAIYMDAFLKPAADAGLEDVTRRLKTEEFLRALHAQLKPKGLVAFNLIERDPSTPSDIQSIQAAFPTTYTFGVPGTGNLVMIGCLETTRLSVEELRDRAKTLDGLLSIGFSFQALAQALR